MGISVKANKSIAMKAINSLDYIKFVTEASFQSSAITAIATTITRPYSNQPFQVCSVDFSISRIYSLNTLYFMDFFVVLPLPDYSLSTDSNFVFLHSLFSSENSLNLLIIQSGQTQFSDMHFMNYLGLASLNCSLWSAALINEEK
jgi:hypothetical protein